MTWHHHRPSGLNDRNALPHSPGSWKSKIKEEDVKKPSATITVMDLCQENEAELENSENDETQSPEKTESTYTCPDESSEKNHVSCLLNISDITLEQDEKARDFVIGTGWEEAVQGWGRTSPTACIWSRKKLKKARVRESASSCLLCVSLSQGSSEAGPQSEVGKLGSVGLEKAQDSPSQTQGTRRGPTTASREISKICFPTSSQGERKSLQIKEFIWCKEDWATPEATRGKGPGQGASISDSLTSRALLVLPPLKASPPYSLDVPGKKSKNFFLQPEDKVLSVEKDECVACACGLKRVDGKGEKRPVELAKYPKVNDTLPFPPRAAPAPLPVDHKRGCLHWSLLPEKHLVCPPNPGNVRCLATVQLLQKQGAQNYRAKFKAREPRPAVNTQKLVLTEAQQENRPKTLETKVFPKTLLPSLTVSRVVIPVSTHRLL